MILSKSGAQPDGLAKETVFAPAFNVTEMTLVPGVVKLPVPVKATVSAAAPLTLTAADRPVEPSQ